METYKIYPIKLGQGAIDKASMIWRRGAGQKLVIPYISFLVVNENRKILVDTGIGNVEYVSKHHYKVEAEPEENLPDQLKAFGIVSDEITDIITTHLHFDHCGGDHYFKNAKFYLQKSEYEAAMNPLPVYRKSYEHDIEGNAPCWWDTRDRYILVDGDLDLFDGIRLLHLPGHSNGSQGVLVNTTAGKYLIAGDSVPIYECLETKVGGKPIPGGILVNMYDCYASMEKMEKEADFILPGHDFRVLDHKCYPV